jgi:hypothetical protein
MRRSVGSFVLLGVAVSLASCSDEALLSSAAPIEPLITTTAAVAPATQEPTPTSTAAATPTTLAADGEPPRVASQQTVGVVIAVDGDLSEIRAFSLLLSDGAVIELAPQAGLLFDEGPLSHVRDHLVSGAPIAVAFHVEAGVAIATKVGDAQ